MARLKAILECLVPCIKQRSRSSPLETASNGLKKKTRKFHNEERREELLPAKSCLRKTAKDAPKKVRFADLCILYEYQPEGHEHNRKILNISMEQDNVRRETEAKESSPIVTNDNTYLEPEQASLDQYSLVKFIGKGGFGNVSLVRRISGSCSCCNQDLFAMKTVRKGAISRDNVSRRIIEKEVFMRVVGHPYLVQLHSYLQTKDTLYFLMDYMPGGTMWHKVFKEKYLSEKLARFYAAELTLAVEHLHTKGIVHRDIKLENVLLDEDGHCKLADFGEAALEVFNEVAMSGICGTVCCHAPEMVLGLNYGPAVDWWALGVLIYEMMVGQHPFQLPTSSLFREKIVHNRVLYPPRLTRRAISILKGFLTKNPERRLGASGNAKAIKEHQFFKRINWTALLEKRVKPPLEPHSTDVIEICPTVHESAKEEVEEEARVEEEVEAADHQNQQACRLMSLHHAHPFLSFFLSILRSFLPSNVPSSFLPNRSHLPFSMPRPPREPIGFRYPRGLLHLPFFPPI